MNKLVLADKHSQEWQCFHWNEVADTVALTGGLKYKQQSSRSLTSFLYTINTVNPKDSLTVGNIH